MVTRLKVYDGRGMRVVLDRAAQRVGSYRQLASTAGVSESFVSLVRHGHREPGQRLLKAIGLRVAYVKDEGAR